MTMSALKWIIALLIVAIVSTTFFHINILQSKPLLLVLGGAMLVLLVMAFLEIIEGLIRIVVSIAAFLFLVYLLMIVLTLS